MDPRLTERQRREREAHDRWAESTRDETLLVRESFESPTALENRFILSHFGDLSGRRVLDLGSGMGEASLYFASRGASVRAVDISPGQLAVLEQAAKAQGLDVKTFCGPAERLPYADGEFDIVYGNGVLHHVEIKTVIPEMRRVLKPGGRFAFIEPLAYNPAIWVYRWLASDVRTQDERPLERADVQWILTQFSRAEHREFWIASLGIFLYFWLGERVSPSEDRYWKKVIRDGERYGHVIRPLSRMDDLLGRIPGVRLMAWNTVLYGER